MRLLARRSGRWIGLRFLPPFVVGMAASIPVLAATVKAARQDWVPAADDGIILTRALAVFSSHSPLVGQYSEAGGVTRQIVHSPGPLLYWLLAIPVRLGGPASAMIAMGIVNTLAIIGCVALARRRGGLLLMFAVAIAIALMCESLGTAVLYDVWNPSAAMFPFLLVIFLGWSVACGEHRLLPALAVVASFVVQTHLTYLAPTAGIVVISMAGLGGRRIAPWWHARRGRGPRPRREIWPWIAGSIGALLVCWSFPLLDEIEHSPGNLTLVVRTARDRGMTLGAHVGWTAVVRAIGWRPWWLIKPASEFSRKLDVRISAGTLATATAILILLALAAIVVAALRFRRGDLAAAAAIGLVMCLGLAADAANTPVSPLLSGTLGYTMWWGSQLGMWVWLTLAWTAWICAGWVARRFWPRLRAALARPLPQISPPRRLAAVLVLSVIGVGATAAVGGAVAANLRPEARAMIYRPLRELGTRIDALIPAGQTIFYSEAKLVVATESAEPALRFMLTLHGDRVLSKGAFPRLGAYYTYRHQPHQWNVVIGDGAAHLAHMRLVATVLIPDRHGSVVLSLWLRHVVAVRTAAQSRPGLR